MGIQFVEIVSVTLLLLWITSKQVTIGQTLPTNWPTLPPDFTYPTLPTNWTFPTLPPGFTFPTIPPITPIKEALVEVDGLGKIQGALTFTSPNGKPFYWFAGIPYAEPASYMANNRFRPALMKTTQLSSSDDTAFNAVNPLVFCPQGDILLSSAGKSDLGEVLKAFKQSRSKKNEFNPKYQGVEDCLVINISSKKIPKGNDTELMPVIFFIHGGSFDAIWGGIFGGHRFLNRDVVLVTINYRLGLLGSLNLGVDEAPGNAAMYDAILALEWVQKYIGYFGGDKNKVTVTGHSAGAVMATHLLTSPLAVSKKIFHGVIGLSGSSVSAWTTCTDPITQHLRVAKHAGCPYSESDAGNGTAIAICMRRKGIEQLRSAMNKYESEEHEQGRFGYDASIPSLQNPSTLSKTDIFMTQTPLEVMRQGKQANVPVMMGAARHDGTFVMESTYDFFLKPNGYDKDPIYLRNEFLTTLLKGLAIDDTTGALIHSLAYTYLGDAMNSDNFADMIPGFIDIHSVFAFKAGAYNLVEMQARKNPNSYYFAFDYQGQWTVDGGDVIPGGVGHIDEIYYLFQAFPLICQEELGVASRFVDYWVNFATYGNPNGPNDSNVTEIFPPYNADTHPFLIINVNDSTGYYCRDSWIDAALEIKDNLNPGPWIPGSCLEFAPTTTTGEPTTENLSSTIITNAPGNTNGSTTSTTDSISVSTAKYSGSAKTIGLLSCFYIYLAIVSTYMSLFDY